MISQRGGGNKKQNRAPGGRGGTKMPEEVALKGINKCYIANTADDAVIDLVV